MPKVIKPITCFTRDAEEAQRLATMFADSRALISRPGTLAFHTLIAQHGAGEFATLYVPTDLKGTFKPPVGGEVRHTTD